MITLRDGIANSYRRGSGPPPPSVTWDATGTSADITISSAGLLATRSGSTSTFAFVIASLADASGDTVFECVLSDSGSSPYTIIGMTPAPLTSYPGSTTSSYGYYEADGSKYNNSTAVAYGASFGNGAVIGVGYKQSDGEIEFFKNGVSQGIAFTGLSGLLYPAGGIYAVGSALLLHAQTSNMTYTYAGYTALGGA